MERLFSFFFSFPFFVLSFQWCAKQTWGHKLQYVPLAKLHNTHITLQKTEYLKTPGWRKKDNGTQKIYENFILWVNASAKNLQNNKWRQPSYGSDLCSSFTGAGLTLALPTDNDTLIGRQYLDHVQQMMELMPKGNRAVFHFRLFNIHEDTFFNPRVHEALLISLKVQASQQSQASLVQCTCMTPT